MAYGLANYIDWPLCGAPASIANTKQYLGLSGLGCASCGGGCNRGLGYFDTGWDVSGWSWMEWGTVALGVYVLMSVFSTTKRGVKNVQRKVGRRRRARRLKERIDES